MSAAGLLAWLTFVVHAAPVQYGEAPAQCTSVTPLLAVAAEPYVAGNFRAEDGSCYVWLNVRYRPDRELACESALHEYGHLLGRAHSTDPSSVMFPNPHPYAPCAGPWHRGAARSVRGPRLPLDASSSSAR